MFSFSAAAYPSQWSQWRGPFANGSSDEKNLITDPNKPENTAWFVDMPGESSATPVISKGRVFVSSVDADTGDLLGLCIDEKTGTILWKKKISTGSGKLPRNNMASPSPAADGQRVIFTFENGDIAAYDYAGERLWKRNLSEKYGSISIKFGYSSTPLIFKNRVYVQILRRPLSYRGPERSDLESLLLILDPANGKTLHKVVRKTSAEGESCDAYSSPMPVEFNDTAEIIILGADFVTGHDPANGKELWRYGTNPSQMQRQRLIPSATIDDGMIFAVQSRSGDLYAIAPGGKGTLTDSDLKWKFTDKTTDSPTPLYYNGRIYTLDGTKNKTLRCIDAKTGKLKWEGKLESDSLYASPTAADGKIFCISEKGKAFVLSAEADSMKVLSTRDFAEGNARSSIAIADGRIFIRTAKKLHCLKKP